MDERTLKALLAENRGEIIRDINVLLENKYDTQLRMLAEGQRIILGNLVPAGEFGDKFLMKFDV